MHEPDKLCGRVERAGGDAFARKLHYRFDTRI